MGLTWSTTGNRPGLGASGLNNRTVTLAGVVDSESDKTLAALKARAVNDVNQVDNELEVATKS